MAAISFTRSEVPGLVSIIIPTYRAEQYIGETLDSISRQTHPHWEVIVVEDGPAGPSQRIVEQFARRHPERRVEYSANGRNYGPSHSRNVAFAQAAGEFVALLDSDDRWFPDHLERSIRELRDAGSDLAYSTALMIEDKTDWIIGVWGPDGNDLLDLPHRLFMRNFITPSATVLRRQVLADVGPWDTDLRYCEDLSFWLRCIAAGKQFHYVGGCHCLYRKNHDGAATRKLCETLETFAVVVERFLDLPGLRHKHLRKYAAQAYVRAARAHAETDQVEDPSADRSRVSPLLLHAWRLRPKRVKYLLQSVMAGVANRLRRPKSPVAVPATEPPARMAA